MQRSRQLVLIFLLFSWIIPFQLLEAKAVKIITLQRRATFIPITSVEVEIADNEESRAKGLMFRKELNPNQGMLFLFLQDTQNPFWMSNTYLSLDLIFINSKNEIVDILENAAPLSEKMLYPAAPYRKVLEVNAGFSKQHRLQRGDRIVD